MSTSINPERGTGCLVFLDGNSIAGEMTSNFNIATEMISANTKTNPDWNEALPGRASADVSMNFILDSGDTGYLTLMTAKMNKTALPFSWKTFNSNYQFTSTVHVTSVNHTAGQDDFISVDASFETCGTVNFLTT